MSTSPAAVILRPECSHDESFIRNLILETIAGELGASEWPEPMRSHLLGLQYAGRRQSFRLTFPEATSYVIEAGEVDAGWAVVTEVPQEIFLVEIMVSPQCRNRGIGSAVIRQLVTEAAARRKPVRLTVNAMNRGAIRLYERLGFRRTGGDEVRYLMECAVSSSSS
jgi:ribosomal protein S18 acetylase RimI-like enzyme